MVYSSENKGYAAALNIGIQKSKGKLLLLANNDILFGEQSLDCLISTLQSQKRWAAISPVILQFESKAIEYAGYTKINPFTGRNQSLKSRHTNSCINTPYLHGACMLIRREILDHAPLLPEIYFLYYEEIEWSHKIRSAGYELGVALSCEVQHLQSLSTSKDETGKYYLLMRNRILYIRRNYNPLNILIFFCYFSLICIPFHYVKNILLGKSMLNKELIRAFRWNLSNNPS